MLNIRVTNYRRTKKAELELSPIAFLSGENENGKSSIAEAVALAATGQRVPEYVPIKDAGILLHKGTEGGMVTIEKDGVTSQITWPKSEFSTKGSGKPLYATEYAVGLRHILDLKQKDRYAFFIDLLNAKPTKEKFTKALTAVLDKNIGKAEERIAKFWEEIQESGWEQVDANTRKKGNDLVALWKDRTGVARWNKVSASNWLPAGWVEDLLDAKLENLEKACADAKIIYENALRAEAVSENERKQLEQLSSLKEEREKAKNTAAEQLKTAQQEVAELKREEAAILPDGTPCPNCSTMLKSVPDLLSYRLEVAEAIPEEERKKRNERLAVLAEEMKSAEAKIITSNNLLSDAGNKLTESLSASERLLALNNAPKEVTISVKDAQESLQQADLWLNCVKRRTEAQGFYDQIIELQDIAAVLGEDGLRKTTLDEEIKGFNNTTLANLSQAFGCPPVILNEELEVFLGEYHYRHLSKAARFTARAILQVAIAKLDQSELLIIDDVDDLRAKERRGGLLGMVMYAGIPALLCMAKQPDENAPNLEALGFGKSYIIQDGVTSILTFPNKTPNTEAA